jgi:PAS domain S-box-containing protein
LKYAEWLSTCEGFKQLSAAGHHESQIDSPLTAGSERVRGTGETAELIRNRDWARTALGAIPEWPDTLLIVLNTVLANPLPMFVFWGDALIQFYNEGAIEVLGPDKHPRALGQSASECWAEIWDTTGPRILAAIEGRPCRNDDQFTPIYRYGKIEEAWFTYSYSPIRDADGAVRGVLVTFLETTGRVLAERAQQAERARLLSLFQQSPAFFAVLRGQEHIFEMVNPPYLRLIGGREVIGKPVGEAIPEAAEQGFVQVLDRVFRTGEPFEGQNVLFTSTRKGVQETEDLYLDFIYQPLREADGSISGILVLGVDITERKRATDALLESERSAANILGSITDGFQLLDAQGRFVQFNSVARHVYQAQGIDPDSLIGKPILSALPGLAEYEGGRAILRALDKRQTSVAEIHYIPWDRWFNVRHYPTPDGGVATFFQDITESKRTETLLREQRERFDFATDAAQIGYWFCNLPFDKLIWDARVKEHFWLPPDAEVDIERFYQILHPDDRERTRGAIEQSIQNHSRYDVEYRSVSPKGQERWLRAIGRTAYDDVGRPLRFDGVTQDITDLKLTREALDAERGRLNAIFENVPVGVVFTEADGRIIRGNPQAERLIGHALSYQSGESYHDWAVLYPDGRPLEGGDHPLTLALAFGGIHRGEYLYHRADESRIWIEFTGAPIRDSNGAIIGAVVAIADLDARKRAEEALIRSEKLAVVGRLAATISHEINNPLEAVTNLLYLIQQNSKDEVAKQFSQAAQDELARVSHIVTHTLRFNRQTYGSMRERVSDLLDSSLAIYEGRLRNSGIELVRDYGDADRILCHGSELRQVFANFIGNSFDATKRGGKLLIRTRNQTNWHSGQPGVRVTIADTGHGIDDKTRRRLFEPFFTTKGDNGTGLGLWVSREILNKHQGSLRMRSSQLPGHSGTTFSIWLPLDIAISAKTSV